jgi:hypothetical protein
MTETRARRSPDLPELDAEQEVDLRRYWRALVNRWWVVAGGLVAGLIVGYLLSLGGNQVYKASALVYLGQPVLGTASVQSLSTNPSIVTSDIHAEAVIHTAAAAAGLRPGELRGHVSTQTIAGSTKGVAKTGQTPLIEISVTGSLPRKTALAASSIANQIVTQLSGLTDVKIRAFKTLLSSLSTQIASNQSRITLLDNAIARSRGLTPLDKLTLVTQADNAEQTKGTLLQNQSTTQQALAFAENVERPQVIEPPVAVKTTARSTRNSMLVGAVIGILIGLFAAFLWEPVARRVRRADV